MHSGILGLYKRVVLKIKVAGVLLVGAFSLKKKNPTITVGSFLVGAFSLKEKCPTITVGSFLFGAILVKRARLLQWVVFLLFFVRLQPSP